MLLIKLSAADLRTIRAAASAEELAGVRQLIVDGIDQAERLKAMGKEQVLRRDAPRNNSIGWGKAFDTMERILGKGNITKPPFPDNSWYARINSIMRREGMGEVEVVALAEHARDKMRSPISFDFLICQRHRILNGEFDVAKLAPTIAIKPPELPEE